ncbi:helix-turn-helix domain-containing protein [Exiguobacterium sp. 17-1]|uniref:helix-turn-helix domain-containing protein n=1 Tax=Exiguobacterium sp. 17-1 TaxID=2931981 RepID=UPI001FFED4BA|nr:helix-turn-helix domain-containing protein [Exiguobacterium sp. 17-1]MCK2156207.1 helix-turn-helix transcriptional regulator [Exiguobacterium sp. 17-1]
MDQFTSPQIGLALRRLRKKHKLTQKDLANGICSQAEISKIESGTHSPTVDLLFALSRRLQVPITVFLDRTEQYDSLRTIDDSLLMKFRNLQYEDIYSETRHLLENFHLTEEASLLYKYYFHLSSYRLKKIDFRTCIVELQKLSDFYSTTYYSPKMLIRLKSAIATIYYENRSFKRGITVYQELLKLNFDNDELMIDRIRILYNFSKILLDMNEISEALVYIEEGIHDSLRFKDMSLLGQLLFQKASALEFSYADLSDIEDAYTKAYLLFDLLGMKEYKEIIISDKMHYIQIKKIV